MLNFIKQFFKSWFQLIKEVKEVTIITIYIVIVNREFNYTVAITLFSFIFITVLLTLITESFESSQKKE